MHPMSDLIKDASDINLDDYNPRLIRETGDTNLGNSMDAFGELSGITFNTKTSTLVTGHQRLRKLRAKYGDRVRIYVDKYAEPDDYGTVGIGYVGVEGTGVRFNYRETYWDLGTEKAANIAANNRNIGGEDDTEKLAQVDYELSQLDNGAELLALTGQSEKELEKLFASAGIGEEEPPNAPPADDPKQDKLSFAVTSEQRGMIERAIHYVTQTESITADDPALLNGAALYHICHQYLKQHDTSDDLQLDQIPS